MENIVAYPTPEAFLAATASQLEARDLENNLILGLCYGYVAQAKACPQGVFVNVFDQGQLQATAIKTWRKALLSGTTREVAHLKALADFYLERNVPLSGVVGESFYADTFARHFGKTPRDNVTMLAHRLTTVNALPLAPGRLEIARADDLEILTDWSVRFEEDARIFPRKPPEQSKLETEAKIEQGDLFKWVHQGEVVSMAAIMRRTKRMGIIGLVYTPVQWRGSGYATSCVQQLSARILADGFSSCGLFTDQANPISNHIYQRIGYVASTEFSDIEFLETV